MRAHLLHVLLQALRQAQVHDRAHAARVHAHAKRDGGHHAAQPPGRKHALHRLALLQAYGACMRHPTWRLLHITHRANPLPPPA